MASVCRVFGSYILVVSSSSLLALLSRLIDAASIATCAATYWVGNNIVDH